MWSAGVSSLHPVVLPSLEALPSSSSSLQKKGRESLKGACLLFKNWGPVMTLSFLLSFHWTVLSHVATPNCKGGWEMYSSYVQRMEIVTFGKELAVPATICPSGHQILVNTLLLVHRTRLLPKRTNPNSTLSLQPFPNVGRPGDVQSPISAVN